MDGLSLLEEEHLNQSILYNSYLLNNDYLSIPTAICDILSTLLFVSLSANCGIHAYLQIKSDLTMTFQFFVGYFILCIASELVRCVLFCGIYLKVPIVFHSNMGLILYYIAMTLMEIVTSCTIAIGLDRIQRTFNNFIDRLYPKLKIYIFILIIFLHPTPFIISVNYHPHLYRVITLVYISVSLVLLFLTSISLYSRLRDNPHTSTHSGVDKTVLLFLIIQFTVLFIVLTILFLLPDKSGLQHYSISYITMLTKCMYPVIYIIFVHIRSIKWNNRVFPWLDSDYGLERRMVESRTELHEFTFTYGGELI
uniref:Uncharacterized protein n=1 Tax=Lepeophtheirus salmonis TaxID=72036 RepID=A0A0K2V4N5_LEPSM